MSHRPEPEPKNPVFYNAFTLCCYVAGLVGAMIGILHAVTGNYGMALLGGIESFVGITLAIILTLRDRS